MDIHIRGRKKAWLKKDKIMKENNIEKNNLLQPSSEQFLAAMSPARRKKIIRRNYYCFKSRA